MERTEGVADSKVTVLYIIFGCQCKEEAMGQYKQFQIKTTQYPPFRFTSSFSSFSRSEVAASSITLIAVFKTSRLETRTEKHVWGGSGPCAGQRLNISMIQ